MSYVVLARKYRPRRFDQMVGQPHVVQALTNALAQQRLHHAYLFTGTRGIGKTTISRILAKSLNCLGPDGRGGITAEPCGVCPACTAIDADRFVDYIELDAASNRSIDEIRDLIERAAYKPSVGRFKVFMIDEAHQLTKDAFNALLKTLEEPPEYLKFVLATTDPEKMLPTVLSRCLQFNLRPMAPETVQDHLAGVLAAEGVAADAAALRLLGRAARGSMRDALSLADQAIAYGGGRIDEAVVRAMLGVADHAQAAALLQAVAARDGAALLAGVQVLRETGGSAAATLEAMATLLQSAAVEQAVRGALDESDPDTPAARALAAAMPADELQLVYSMLLQGRGELALAGDDLAALTMVLLRPLAFAPAGGAAPATPTRPRPLRATTAAATAVRPAAAPRVDIAADPDTALDAAAGPRAAGGAPETAAAARRAEGYCAERTSAERRLSAGQGSDATVAIPRALGDRWDAVVQQLVELGRIGALTRELAQQAGLAGIDEAAQPPRWRLVVARETLRAPALSERLGEALASLVGTPLAIAVAAGQPDDTPALRAAAARARRLREAEQLLAADPVVQALLRDFPGARIVPGSVEPLDPSH
ncbi:MAG TPA: DNA polymerase III subunit gamma/tau [Rubrivivax sp.]|nr:DNA polymerase III subunit gamma/tau [Rubrivivax sp.]